MNTEKDTCQKSGTSVIFQKEITQCRECPHCRIAPDPDDWFNDDDEKALCKEAGNKLIEGMTLRKGINSRLVSFKDQLDSSTQFHTPKRLKWGSGSKYG